MSEITKKPKKIFHDEDKIKLAFRNVLRKNPGMQREELTKFSRSDNSLYSKLSFELYGAFNKEEYYKKAHNLYRFINKNKNLYQELINTDLNEPDNEIGPITDEVIFISKEQSDRRKLNGSQIKVK